MGTSTRKSIIALEQKAVDRAYERYEARVAELSGNSAATASASGKDSIAVRRQAQERAEAYGGLGDEALVFARVDAPEDPGGDPRPWYIGRRSVFDEQQDPVVVLWTSPLAKQWTDAQPDTPGDIVLRRRLRCVRQTVKSYFDEIAVAQAAAVPAPRPPARTADVPKPRTAADDTDEQLVFPDQDSDSVEPAPAARPAAPKGSKPKPAPAAGPAPVPAPETEPETQASELEPVPLPRARRPKAGRTPGDVAQVVRRKPLQPDNFLLSELERARGGRMRAIVETIRRDQMNLVTGSPTDILLVQGGPGTGKSAVGLHRVTWLVNNEHFKAQERAVRESLRGSAVT